MAGWTLYVTLCIFPMKTILFKVALTMFIVDSSVPGVFAQEGASE